jgi:PAS domain-containing protein
MRTPGLPLTHCTAAFSKLTGWTSAEAVGRNCRFLQGEGTEPGALSTLVTSIRQGSPCAVQITNIRKDGTSFVNDLTMHHVRDTVGERRFCECMRQSTRSHAI